MRNQTTYITLKPAAGDDVSSVYLDDQVSGFTITDNTFINVSRAMLLGGGEDITFTGNTISIVENSNAVAFDNRGMGWQSAACATNPPGELVLFLQVTFSLSCARLFYLH